MIGSPTPKESGFNQGFNQSGVFSAVRILTSLEGSPPGLSPEQSLKRLGEFLPKMHKPVADLNCLFKVLEGLLPLVKQPSAVVLP